jgi:hypothetical protein
MTISQQLTEALSIAGKAPVKVWLTVLTSKLTQYDQRVSGMEAKRGNVNIYRLGHLFGAAQEVEKATKSFADRDDPEALKKLKDQLDKSFIPGALSPVEYVKKAIDKYLADGTLPKITGKQGTALRGLRP